MGFSKSSDQHTHSLTCAMFAAYHTHRPWPGDGCCHALCYSEIEKWSKMKNRTKHENIVRRLLFSSRWVSEHTCAYVLLLLLMHRTHSSQRKAFAPNIGHRHKHSIIKCIVWQPRERKKWFTFCSFFPFLFASRSELNWIHPQTRQKFKANDGNE